MEYPLFIHRWKATVTNTATKYVFYRQGWYSVIQQGPNSDKNLSFILIKELWKQLAPKPWIKVVSKIPFWVLKVIKFQTISCITYICKDLNTT